MQGHIWRTTARTFWLFVSTVRKLGAMKKGKSGKPVRKTTNQADCRELGEVIFTSLSELGEDGDTSFFFGHTTAEESTTAATQRTLRAGAGGDEGSTAYDEVSANYIDFQFALNFFLMRKADGKQFALCAGSSEEFDLSCEMACKIDGLARRPDERRLSTGRCVH